MAGEKTEESDRKLNITEVSKTIAENVYFAM